MLARVVRSPVYTMSRNNVRSMSASPPKASSDTVLVHEADDVGVITLNRPKALNAINLEMVQKIVEPLKRWQNSKSLVIMKGAGGKAFCAGGDVRTLVESRDVEAGRQFFAAEYTVNHLIGTYKVPYVAFIDGVVMGGGVGLSVHGKYRVATEKSLFAMPETIIGLFPDVGASYFLPRLEGKLGLYLGLTGIKLKGKDVLKAGVATHFCESGKLSELEGALINNPNEVSEILTKFCPTDNHEFVLQKQLKQINECFSAPTIEGILSNLEKENSEWAHQTIKTLRTVSPTSLKVTHRELAIGANSTLAQCLQMEYRLAVHHVEKSDFHEGVRALLIDKDNSPKWDPKTIEEVSDEHVQSFFRPLADNKELIFEAQSKL